MVARDITLMGLSLTNCSNTGPRIMAASTPRCGQVVARQYLMIEPAHREWAAWLYLKRWKIEGTFHELTVALNCELNTLGYPKAAWFGFCTAVMAYNVLAVLKAAMRAVHGEEKIEKEVSGYYMALEWGLVYAGMMIALPAQEWEVFGHMPAVELAGYLRDWASKINMDKIKKAPPRKPTKERTKRIKDDSPHLSTARLLDEVKKPRAAKTQVQNQR